MRFSVKIAEIDNGSHPEPRSWWEEHDDARVQDNRDAFAYGKVLCEYWNTDLRSHELARKVVNAQVTGPGKKRPPKSYDPAQMDFFRAPKRAQ